MSDRKDGSANCIYAFTEADAEFNKEMGVEVMADLAKPDVGSLALSTELQQVRIKAPLATELVAQIPLDQHLSSAS